MLVTKKAPDFKAAAVLGNNQIVEDFELSKNLGKMVRLYSFGQKILLLYVHLKSLLLIIA